jgi:chaperonin GroEL (HSP60 family)
MATALMEPFDLLLNNCGEHTQDVWPLIKDEYENQKGLPTKVFDANAHEVVDPMVAGIIEPAKVCRVTIGNALSVASLLVTLGGIVVTPRNAGLEQQLELSKSAFKDMMSGTTGHVGQE